MKYTQRIISLNTPELRNTAKLAIDNAPTDINLEMVIREHKKQRSNSQNNLYWADLADIANQVWLDGRQYSAEVWHHYLKGMLLPNETEPYIFELVKNADTYRKYQISPSGDRVLTGSTTDLTTYGFNQYMTQVQAWAGEHGVLFSAKQK